MKRCFLLGHRDTDEKIFPILQTTIEKHIVLYGVTEFIVGNYGSFDRMAKRAVRNMKQRYPLVKLISLLPYYPAQKHRSLEEETDGSLYPPGMEKVPYRLAILKANQYMVEYADYLIVYAQYSYGNAYRLLQYAQTKPIHIENIATRE